MKKLVFIFLLISLNGFAQLTITKKGEKNFWHYDPSFAVEVSESDLNVQYQGNYFKLRAENGRIIFKREGYLFTDVTVIDETTSSTFNFSNIQDLEAKLIELCYVAYTCEGIKVETDPIYSAWDKDYNDLINTPTITAETDPIYSAWDKDYNDLINTPIIPTETNTTLTISNDELLYANENNDNSTISLNKYLQNLTIDDTNYTITISDSNTINLSTMLQNFSDSNQPPCESKNLFDKNTMIDPVDGAIFYTTGTIVNAAGSKVSTYIEIEPNTDYYISGRNVGSNLGSLALYDASFNPLPMLSSPYYTSFPQEGGFTTYANAKYVAFQIAWQSVGDADNIQLEKGTSATTYSPYGDCLADTGANTGTSSNTGANTGTTTNQTIGYLADIYKIPSYGQSLSTGAFGGTTTFSSVVPNTINTSGVATNSQDMNGGYAEMINHLAKEFEPLPNDFKIMTSVNGVNGSSIAGLSKGGVAYNNLLQSITDGKAYVDANNLTYNVPGICWTQGEEQMRTGGVPTLYGTGTNDPFTYSDQLETLQQDLSTDIKAITGQTNDVKFIMYQVASHNFYKRYPRIALEQLELAITNKNFVLAKTMYDVDYTADQVHAPNKTYRNMGNHYGIALYKSLILNENVKPIYPVDHYIKGNDVYLKFNVPAPPLVFDTTLVAQLADGNYGFNLVSVSNETNGTSGTISAGSQTITNVELFNDETIKITLSGVPTAGDRLTYGVNGTGWDNISGTGGVAGASGRDFGARGNLRDSQTYINPVEDYINLYNWCPIFEIQF